MSVAEQKKNESGKSKRSLKGKISQLHITNLRNLKANIIEYEGGKESQMVITIKVIGKKKDHS
jgi:hypothetical protein